MSSTFQDILNLLCLIPLILFLRLWWRKVRPQLRPTTLTGAGVWLLVAASSWLGCVTLNSVLEMRGDASLRGLSMRWEYLCLTLWLTPIVAVLGAKRPGVRFWNVFVVIPMLLMLNWPAFSAKGEVLLNSGLDLEAPALMGYFVVLLMILGNYFGTVFTLPALLICGALAYGVCPFNGSLAKLLPGDRLQEGIISLLLAGGLFWSGRILKRETQQRQGFERVWLDFRDWFGILWTRRAMDRLNQTAETEQWNARLSLDGIEWQNDLSHEERTETREKMDHAFRWLFRRFVDDSWIDERLTEL